MCIYARGTTTWSERELFYYGCCFLLYALIIAAHNLTEVLRSHNDENRIPHPKNYIDISIKVYLQKKQQIQIKVQYILKTSLYRTISQKLPWNVYSYFYVCVYISSSLSFFIFLYVYIHTHTRVHIHTYIHPPLCSLNISMSALLNEAKNGTGLGGCFDNHLVKNRSFTPALSSAVNPHQCKYHVA